MRRFRVFPLFLLLVVSVFDSSQSVRLYAQTPAPTRILVCESPGDACSRADARLDIVWSFNGTDGTATSASNPAGSRLSIDKFDSESIVVRRVDQAGPMAGLTAVYNGAVRGTQISGRVQWSWPGHGDYPASGIFTAQLQDQVAVPPQPEGAPEIVSGTTASSLPAELLVCENNGVCNVAWILHGSEGTGTWFTRNPARARLTVLRSAPDDILIRRVDTTDGVAATYAGSLRGDHYGGTIVWNTGGMPGERTGSWTAVVPQTRCDGLPELEPTDALRIGQNALMFHRDLEALDCYVVAAKAGDATAQVAVGMMYYQGRGEIAQNYAQAFFWLHKAADQGVYAAQRTVSEMYAAGQGTQRDSVLSGIYTARADEQKHDAERRQDVEDRAADRRAQVLSSFVLGASFGASLFLW